MALKVEILSLYILTHHSKKKKIFFFLLINPENASHKCCHDISFKRSDSQLHLLRTHIPYTAEIL